MVKTLMDVDGAQDVGTAIIIYFVAGFVIKEYGYVIVEAHCILTGKNN